MLSVVLIHNEEVERLKSIRPALKNIVKKTSAVYLEISSQKLIKRSPIKILTRQLKYFRLQVKWAAYVKASDINFVKVNFLLFKHKFGLNFIRKEGSHRVAIEHAVSVKHLEAISNFVSRGSEEDFLVVFESDAIIDNMEILLNAISFAREQKNKNIFYLFSSYFSPKELNLDLRLIEKTIHSNFSIVRYPRYITNTSCCYGLTFELAQEIIGSVKLSSKELYLPLDWLINISFYNLFKKHKKNLRGMETIFFDPSPVTHGSFTKAYASSFESIKFKKIY